MVWWTIDIGLMGTRTNEIQVRDSILETIQKITSQASPRLEVNVETQHPSGNFTIDFIGHRTHMVYADVTNILVRVHSRLHAEPQHCILVGSHFDAAPGSPGMLWCGRETEALVSGRIHEIPALDAVDMRNLVAVVSVQQELRIVECALR